MHFKNFLKIKLILLLLTLSVTADGYLDRNQQVNNYTQTETVIIREKGINIVVTYPRVVIAGEYFTIKAKMINHRNYARMGGLTLSFPQMTSVSGQVIHSSFDNVKGYPPYSKLYNKYLKRAKRSSYYMIEGWEKKWYSGYKKGMKLRVKAPYGLNKFYINVRGVLHFGRKYDRYEVTIPRYGAADQQGYRAKSFSIRVIN